tara:strand:+ start:292 stop:831 length:540 start_codon:yes stop_codon:yes gene_type:complete
MSFAYTPGTTAGNMYEQGISGLTDLGNKYKDNEAVGGLVAGTFADTFRTQAMGGLSLQYNQAMSSHLANLQQGMENLRTGNQLKLMGAEGRIAKDLVGAQGEQQRLGIRETGSQQRMNIAATGAQERMNIGARGSEQRKGIVTAGQQERLNIGERYKQERGMRSDARGAIRSLGARFFG